MGAGCHAARTAGIGITENTQANRSLFLPSRFIITHKHIDINIA